MVSESWNTPEDWYETNITCLAKLISGFLNRGTYKLRKFIQFTTPEVYGSTTGKVTENWQFKPTTPYAISRAAGDFHLKALYENLNFPVIFTRTANVYGPHQKLYRVIPKLITKVLNGDKFQLHGGGHSLRSFIHSEDVSSALMKVMQAGVVGESYHISTECVVSIRELVERILSRLGLDFEANVDLVPDRIGKDNAYLLDSKKIRSELDWSDTTLLDQGLDQTIEWIQRDWEVLRSFQTDYVHTR
jgi:dTDP-glucose 4,6-dehydratase